MVLAYFFCCYHASRYRARARTRQKRAVPRHNNNNNNNKDSKNHQQQQSWLVPWGIAGFAKPINIKCQKDLRASKYNNAAEGLDIKFKSLSLMLFPMRFACGYGNLLSSHDLVYTKESTVGHTLKNQCRD